MKTTTFLSIFGAWLVLSACQAGAQNPFGTGVDGDLTVSSGTVTTDAVRSAVTGLNTPGDTSLDVADANGFSAGDEIVVITMIDPETNLGANAAGTYENHTVVTVDTGNNILILATPLAHDFSSADGRIHQVIRVPHYNDVTVSTTLTCADWNGATGGVLFFRATGAVVVNEGGTIHATAKGYRGGLGNFPDGQLGGRGEGVNGNYNIQLSGTSGNAGGSGNGGGGGGNGANGEGSAIEPDIFGAAVGDPALNKLTMGGGGGGGDDNDSNRNDSTEARGGEGGGIILIYASEINADSIVSNGTAGTTSDPHAVNDTDGGGGGGAGGSVHLIAKSVTVNELKAEGAIGGPKTCTGCWPEQDRSGGDGGDGRIRIDSPAVAITDQSPASFSGDFLNIAHTPLLDTPQSATDAVSTVRHIEAFICDDNGDPITSAGVFFRLAGEETFNEIAMTTSDNTRFTASLPAQNGGATVEYYLEAATASTTYNLPIAAPAEIFSYAVTGSAPVNMTATANTDGTTTINWSQPENTANLTGFSVYRTLAPDEPPEIGNRVAALGASDFSFDDSGLLDFTTYHYVVTAVYDIGGVVTEHAIAGQVLTNDALEVTIRGEIFLEFASNHANIAITFNPISPSAVFHEVTTNALGFFETVIAAGVYDVTYSIGNYQDFPALTNESIIDDLDMGSITLDFLGTVVEAGDVSGTWDGIFSIHGDVVVPAGETLTILPGSEVRFVGAFQLDVNGLLTAIGTPESKILFTSLPANQQKARGQWAGIDFNGTSDDNSLVQHAVVEFAVDGIFWTDSNARILDSVVRENSSNGLDLRGDGSDPQLENVEVYNNSSSGIWVENADPTFINFDIHNNSGGGMSSDETSSNTSHVRFEDTRIAHNNSNGIFKDRRGSLTLINCDIDDNNAHGVRTDEADLTMENCMVRNNSNDGIRVNDVNRDWVTVLVSDTVVDNNRDNGIYLFHRVLPQSIIERCTFTRNGNPSTNDSPGVRFHHRMHGTVRDNIIANNHSHGILYNTSTENNPTITRNIVAYNFHDGLHKGNTSFTSTITYNIFYQNGSDGIEINHATGTEIIIGNAIINNGQFGIRANAPINGAGEAVRFNNIFGNSDGHTSDLNNLPVDALIFNSTNENGDLGDIYLNISEAPEFTFADGDELDFTLAATSPHIDAGDRNDYDLDGTFADIGALYRDAGNPHTISTEAYADGTVSIGWTAVDNAVNGTLLSYNVYHRADGETDFTFFSNTAALTADVSGLVNNTLYEFAVSGVYDGAFESILSPNTAVEKPGLPEFSPDPVAFLLDIPEEGLIEDLVVLNSGSRDLNLSLPIGTEVGSVFFSDTTEFGQVGNIGKLSSLNQLTMECWIRRQSDGHFEFMGKNFQEYQFYVNSSNRLGMYKGYNMLGSALFQNWTSSYVLPFGEWHHVAATWDGDRTISFYVDGSFLESFDTAAPLPIHNWGHVFEIGRRAHDGGHHMVGYLAEVRVWNVARKEDEIREFRDAALDGDEPGLVGYWPLHTDTVDRSPSPANMTLHSGAGLVTNVSPPTLELLPFTLPDIETYVVAPAMAATIPFAFADIGINGTNTHTTPIFTDIPDENGVVGFDESQIDYELALSYGTVVPATPTHFDPLAIDQTGSTYTVVITHAAITGFDGQNTIDTGDEIGVFDDERLVGAARFAGDFNLVLTLWGGAGGFSGNPMSFRIYDISGDREAVTTPIFAIGTGSFAHNLFSSATLDGTIFVTQDIAISAGIFNLISTNLLPRFPDAETVFSSVASLRIADNDQGQVLLPEFPVNSIGDIDIRDGYRVFADNAETLTIEGVTIDPAAFTITLEPAQWNAIAFLGSGPQDVTTAFGDINDSIAAVQTSTGLMFEPDMAVNTIVDMVPGLGYQVLLKPEVATPVDFSYTITGPAPVGGGSIQTADHECIFESVAATGQPYNIVIEDAGGILVPGTAVAVFENNQCVGSAIYKEGETMHVTAWKEVDESGIALPGFSAAGANPIRIFVHYPEESGENDGPREVFATFSQGNGTFGDGVYAIASIGMPDLRSTGFDVSPDNVTQGTTQASFTITNQGNFDSGPFSVNIVLSDDDQIGNGDDIVAASVPFLNLTPHESVTQNVTIALDRTLLYARAMSDDPPDSSNAAATNADVLGLVIDVGGDVVENLEANNINIGQGVDLDDITFFPWDVNPADGVISPTDAIFVINRLGQTDDSSGGDIDGDGAISPTDAISIINRIGLTINSTVFED